MPFLSETENASLSIVQMIFHIVGPIDEPIFLEELAPNQQLHSFFLERIRSGSAGNRYEFKDGSKTEMILKKIESDLHKFSECSKELAADFHRHHRKTASPGAFLIFGLETAEFQLFSMLKYDDDQAIEYDYRTEGGRNEATLRFLERTFVRKPEAMQKLALVRLGDDDQKGQLAVRDRSRSDGISEYFEKFLSVRRIQNEAGMTEKLQTALNETMKQFAASLPPEIRKNAAKRVADALQRTTTFEHSEPDRLLSSIIGGVDIDQRIRTYFHRRLSAYDIEEESFKISKEYIRKPKSRRIETVEGIRIIYDTSVEGLVDIDRTDPDGSAIITIRTQRIETEDYDTESGRFRG